MITVILNLTVNPVEFLQKTGQESGFVHGLQNPREVSAPASKEGKKGGNGFRGGAKPVVDLTRPFGNLLLQLGIEVYAVGVDDLENRPEMQGDSD